MLLTLDLPPDLTAALAAEAGRLGTTPELLAVDAVRRVLPPPPPPAVGARTMLDFLDGYIGMVAGSGEAYSEDCGRKFTDALVADRDAKR